ncbi:MAG: 2-amino-4-hydroxy-6-hydroxymethyldihydropteridine diphosphokinase [Chloroflexi bacterium]|nr:2-amino-4-hydroxy-6-hydroxymethyldihydropteridine diphosphokinase [Chloroflexota bacterium]
MEHIAYLALGSNMGNRLTNLKAAAANLTPQMAVKNRSSIYETPPWGFTEQAEFLNQVLMVYTYLKPQALLDHLKRLETALGRVPSFPNGPRLIDIDILFYDDLVLDTPSLVIPHPRLHERPFVLVPLAEIAPDHVHPVLGKPVHALLDEVDRSDIKLFK